MPYDPMEHFARTDAASSRGKSAMALAKNVVANSDLRRTLAEALGDLVKESQETGELPDPKTSERLIQQTLLLDLSDQLLEAKPDPYQTRETVKALGAWRSSGKTAHSKSILGDETVDAIEQQMLASKLKKKD